MAKIRKKTDQKWKKMHKLRKIKKSEKSIKAVKNWGEIEKIGQKFGFGFG